MQKTTKYEGRAAMNILHADSFKDCGGAQLLIIKQCLELTKRGHNTMIACQTHSFIEGEAEKANVPTVILKMRKGFDYFLGTIKAMQILKKNRIDLVHTNNVTDSWCFSIAAKCLGIPVVRTRHVSVPIRQTRLAHLLYMKLMDKVITSGSVIRNQMIKLNKFYPERIVSVPAGIDEKIFSPSVDGSSIKEEFHLGDTDFVVATVAMLQDWKGHGYLVEAVKLIEKEIPNIKLIIVGDGPEKGNLKKSIELKHLENKVIMTGYRDDVPQLMKNFDLFVLASTCVEATSQVVPEALAMNIPVVATEAGGLGEIVIHEKTGIIVPKKDSYGLSQAILWVYRNYDAAKKMADQGRDLVLRRFTLAQTIDKTEEIYMGLLREGN